MMKDSKGRDVQVGDIVFYGERTYNKGGPWFYALRSYY
ncbi:hypothetical protein VMC05_147 [Klebsiella phage ValerieMcCarty05]|nr:hypothetical protein VMC04_142 [Klebsiella phage ValerieMcCarty04]WPH67616.1 hypothetical protein VMC05_147 [Klebsiella phage ValerieMcCarty05]